MTDLTLLSSQYTRFILFGVFNTAFTYLLYCALVFVMHPQLAYALAYIIGIALAWVGNSKFVFRQLLYRKTAAIYVCMYLAQYLLTAALSHALTLWITTLGPRTALAITLIIITPLSFIWNRMLLIRCTV